MEELQVQLTSLQGSLEEALAARDSLAKELEEAQETLYSQIADLKQQGYEQGERLERAVAKAGSLQSERDGLQVRITAQRQQHGSGCSGGCCRGDADTFTGQFSRSEHPQSAAC